MTNSVAPMAPQAPIDWAKPVECDKGFVMLPRGIQLATLDLMMVGVDGNTRVTYLVDSVTGKAPDILGPEFDVRPYISIEKKLKEELLSILSDGILKDQLAIEVLTDTMPTLKKLLSKIGDK